MKHFTDILIESLDEAYYKSPYLNSSDPAAAQQFDDVLTNNKLIDIEAFHKAWDKDIDAIGLLDVFDSRTTEHKLFNRGVYGQIKNSPDQTLPVIKALKKLWVAQFKDNLRTVEENKLDKEREAKEAAAKAEAEKKAAEEEAARLAQEKAREENDAKLTATLLPELDQRLLGRLKELWADKCEIGIQLIKKFGTFNIYIVQKPRVSQESIWDYPAATFTDKNPIEPDELVKDLNEKIINLIKATRREIAREAFLTNIDWDKYPNAKELYYQAGNKFYKLTIDNSQEKPYNKIKYVKEANDEYATQGDFPSDLGPSAKLVGVGVGHDNSSGRAWQTGRIEYSLNSAMPDDVLKKFGLNIHDDNSPWGSTVYEVTKSDAAKNPYMYVDANFNLWRHMDWVHDSSD